MRPDTIEFIADTALNLIQDYNIRDVRKDYKKLVSDLGGQLVAKPCFDEAMDECLCKTGVSSFEIYYNPAWDDDKLLLRILHTLGNLVLHMGYLIDHDLWTRMPVDQPQRFFKLNQNDQANWFVLAMLCPVDSFRHCLEKASPDEHHVDIKTLAMLTGLKQHQAETYGKILGVF